VAPGRPPARGQAVQGRLYYRNLAAFEPGRTDQRARVTTCSRYDDVLLPPLPAIPGMVTDSECRYLYWLTATQYTGQGAVVELGTWLGRSTLHLAAGLRDAGYPDALDCFDQFVWRGNHARAATLPLQRGDDFQPYFESNVRPVYPRLRVTKAAIEAIVWPGRPIEILFLDAPKRLDTFSATLAAFAPALVPGVSRIVFQDFLHPPAFALPAVVACLGPALEAEHVVADGVTVGFRVKEPLPYGTAQPIDWNFWTWSAEEIVDEFERLLAPLPAEARACLWLSAALLLVDRREGAAAREIAERVGADAALRPHLQAHAGAFLYDNYRGLHRAAGLDRPDRRLPPAKAVRTALRRTRAAVRRWLRPPGAFGTA